LKRGKGPPLARSVRWFRFGPAESDPTMVGVSIDLKTSLVDDNVMVEPAEGDQIIRVGRAALRPGGFMVCFQPVSGIAAVGFTDPAGTMEYCSL